MSADDRLNFTEFLRPNYEAKAAFAWAASSVAAVMIQPTLTLPAEPFHAVAVAAAAMVVWRSIPAIKNWRGLRRMLGFGVEFTDHQKIAKWVKKNPDDMLLGYGFEWGQKHIQRATEIMGRNWGDLIPRSKKESGYHWLHGLEEGAEKPVALPLDMSKGHVLLVGTTRAGKSVLFRMLISQAIARGEPVIIVDPKGDPDMMEETRQACEAHGKEFFYLHPAFPEESVRINLIRNYSRGTDIAGRIASIMPSGSGGDPFVAFGHMSLNNVIQGMLLIQQRPTLVGLRRALEGGVDGIVYHSTAAWADEVIPNWESIAHTWFAKANTPAKKADAMVQFYRDKIQPIKANQDLEGLHSMHQHNKEHFSKMIASLLPLLTMLTSGEMGAMLSPEGADANDKRTIVDLSRVIHDGHVLYVGLSSLSDAQVGGAIGALLMADLAAVAAERYNYGIGDSYVNIFVDEASEAANVPLTQVLNKGGGAKLRMHIATQTIADFAAKLGTQDKAIQMLANLNNVIALRVKDPKTQEFIADNLPMTRYVSITRSQGVNTHSGEPILSTGNQGERMTEEEVSLFPPQLLGSLPDLEYIAKFANGKVMKGRVPILLEDKRRSS